MIDWFTYAETEYGIVLNQTARNRFELYYRELVEWNSRFNLTAIRDQREIELKHFLDSISIAHVVTHAPESLVDVGTGAGFPGMALKILWPGTRLTLVESVQKKANFCMHVAKVLELREVTVLAQRAEDVGQDPEHREKYQLVTGRAVAAMPVWSLRQAAYSAACRISRLISSVMSCFSPTCVISCLSSAAMIGSIASAPSW